MNAKTLSNGIIRALLIVTGTLFFLWFLFTIQSVLVYIIIASIISLIARPLLRFLNKKLKLPNFYIHNYNNNNNYGVIFMAISETQTKQLNINMYK